MKDIENEPHQELTPCEDEHIINIQAFNHSLRYWPTSTDLGLHRFHDQLQTKAEIS